MSTQTLAQGSTISSKYGRLGGIQGKKMVPPPSHLLGAVVGFSNRGKSHFLQSHPGNFIFNLDASSTSNPNPQAMIWPGIDPSGNPCEQCAEGDAGAINDPSLGWIHRIEPSWDLNLEKKKMLLEMAKNDEPRPETISLDTIYGAIKQVMVWVTKNAVALGCASSPKESFHELYGESAWDRVYQEILNFGLDLRNAGYGFFYVIHLAEKMVKRRGNEEREREVGFNITDNFWLRLFPCFEIVLEIDRENRVREVIRPGRALPGGKVGPPTKVNEAYQQYVLVVDSPDVEKSNIVKRRVSRMPAKIDLPESNSWEVFTQAYLEAAS